MSKAEDIRSTHSTHSTVSTSSTAQKVRMIHYFYYTEYKKLADLGFVFHTPRKERNTYISYLQNPIYLTLPKSEILEIYECNITQENRLKYVVDIESRGDLVRFLTNLDKLCIELSSVNSNKWFKKSVEKEVLQELYYSVYGEDKEENNEHVMEIIVEQDKLLDQLVDYNRNDSLNLMVCIKGIEFFKSRFKWYITLEKLVTIPSVVSSSKKNTISLDSADNSDVDTDKDSGDDSGDDSGTDSGSDSGEDNDANSDNYESGNNSSDDEPRTTTKVANVYKENAQPTADVKHPMHRMSRNELEQYIREKTDESKKLFLNSERVRKTADIIYRRAIQLQNEVSRCKELLRSRNE